MNVATRRVMKDIDDLKRHPEVGFCEPVDGNLRHLLGQFRGPENSPYEDGKFLLNILIPSRYPLEPPRVSFKHCVYHPNVNANTGDICIDILKSDSWRPIQNLRTILLSIKSLLSDPNPDDPLEWAIAEQFTGDHAGFERKAREFTKVYATGNINEGRDSRMEQELLLGKFTAMGFPEDLVSAVLKEVGYQGDVEQHDDILQRLRNATA